MTELRRNFLNWRPDRDEFNTDGLQVADNVVHDSEGYKQVLMHTAGATGTGTGPSTIVAFREVAIGDTSQTMKAWLYQTASSLAFIVGVSPGSSIDEVVSSTVTSVDDSAITSLAVAELDDRLFITAEAEVRVASGPTLLNITGYTSFNV